MENAITFFFCQPSFGRSRSRSPLSKNLPAERDRRVEVREAFKAGISIKFLDPSLPDVASPDPWARSGHPKIERMALRAPVRRCAMGVMAHPAFHLAHVGPVGIRGGLSCAFAHGPEFPVAAHTPGGGRLLLRRSLPVARGAGDPGSGMPCREEGALRRLNGEDPWFPLPAEQDPDQQHDDTMRCTRILVQSPTAQSDSAPTCRHRRYGPGTPP